MTIPSLLEEATSNWCFMKYDDGLIIRSDEKKSNLWSLPHHTLQWKWGVNSFIFLASVLSYVFRDQKNHLKEQLKHLMTLTEKPSLQLWQKHLWRSSSDWQHPPWADWRGHMMGLAAAAATGHLPELQRNWLETKLDHFLNTSDSVTVEHSTHLAVQKINNNPLMTLRAMEITILWSAEQMMSLHRTRQHLLLYRQWASLPLVDLTNSSCTGVTQGSVVGHLSF